MKSDAIAFGIAGVLFGLIAGWIIGTQQATSAPGAGAAPPAAAAPARGAAGARAPRCSTRRRSTRSSRSPSASRRTRSRASQLGNLYFDAERYDDAIKWYGEALKLAPNDVNVSTDLGVCYYYTNQPDKALEQFDTR